MKINFGLWIIVLTLSASGCASRGVQVFARCATQFSSNATNRLAVVINPESSAEQKEAGNELIRQLSARGFKIVSQEQAQFTVAYWVENNLQEITVEIPAPVRRQEIIVVRGGRGGSVISTPMGLPQQNQIFTEVRKTKSLRIHIYSNEAVHTGRLEKLWEGSIVDKPKRFDTNRTGYMSTLLDYYGRTYIGRVQFP